MTPSRTLRGAARKAARRGSFLLGSAFAISFAVNVLRLTGPLFMLLVYDRVLTSRSVETLVALFALLLVLLLVLGTLDYARKRILARFGAQFQEQMEETLLEHTNRSQLFQHGKTKPVTGLDEVDGLRGFLHSGSLIAIFDFLWAPMFIIVVYILHPTLGWVCMGGIGVIALLVLSQFAFMAGRQERARAAGDRITALRNMLIASRETVRAQDMGIGYKERWKASRDDSRDHSIALKDWTAWFDSMSKITVMIVRYSVLATGAYLTLQGELTVGAMVAATFMVTRVLGPVNQFFAQLPNSFTAWDNWKRLNGILARRAHEIENEYAEHSGAAHRLVLDNVSIRSPLTNAMILRSVSLSVSAGQLIEINGASSQGKTVLAETILGMWPNASGTILLNGHNTARLSDAEATRLIGFAPDAPRFVAGTIEENIAGLDPDADPETVSLAARRARMNAAICAFPDGFQTLLDADASCLSSFERKQLALARAFYHCPQLLIIDELDLDMMTRIPRKLQQTFASLIEKHETTIILLARQPLNLAGTSRRFHLHDGRLTELTSVKKPKTLPQQSTANDTSPAAPAKMTLVGKDAPRSTGKA